MPVPKYDDLFTPTLQALHELGGSASVDEIEETVIKILKLPEKDVNEIHRGSDTKLSYNLRWARTYLKRFGLIENSVRGVWALTQQGGKVQSVDKKEVVKKVLQLNREQRLVQEGESEEIESEIDEQISWKEELLDTIKAMSPASFENLCKRLLRESGFINVEVLGKSGDGGIDGKGVVKLGGLLSFNVVFQAKRFKNTVSPSVVRDFRGAMIGKADKGLIITTGRFTREARLEAQRDGAPPIDLIDGDELAEKLKVLSLGVQVERQVLEKIIINKDWFAGI